MSEIPRGAIRFNTDSNKPELWDGSQWAEFQLSTPNLGRGADTEPGARGVFVGGYIGSGPTLNTANSDYINIASTGDAQNFGDLAQGLRYAAGCSSNTRGLTFSGYNGTAYSTTIYKTTIASTGSHASFGDVTPAGRLGHSCWSSQTRAIMFSGAVPGAQDGKIKYVTIASEGDTVDFGDLTSYNFRYGSSTGNRTRAIAMGGFQDTPLTTGAVNTIQFVTISTLGNGQDFGELTVASSDGNGSTSNGIISVVALRDNSFSSTTLDQLRPNILSNSYSFGDLSASRVYSPNHSCMSSPTRGIFGGGVASPATPTDVIDYVSFATEGNAVDFGDMVGNSGNGYSAYSSFSNAHGGL